MPDDTNYYEIFSNSNYDATLYVPYNSAIDYIEVGYWNLFANIVGMGYPHPTTGDLYNVNISHSHFSNGNMSFTIISYKNKEVAIYRLLNSYDYNNQVIKIPEYISWEGNKYKCISIHSGAFWNANIKSVIIPNTITTIGSIAFQYCKNLAYLDIPTSITSIEPNAFRGCSSLTSLTFPNSLTDIGWGAFEECTNLTKVTFLSSTPPKTVSGLLYGSNINVIYVPVQSVEAYKSANGWKDYADKIKPIP